MHAHSIALTIGVFSMVFEITLTVPIVLAMIHPHTLTPVRMGKRTIDSRLMQGIWGFFGLYMATFALLVLLSPGFWLR